jgi:hypothetical protein
MTTDIELECAAGKNCTGSSDNGKNFDPHCKECRGFIRGARYAAEKSAELRAEAQSWEDTAKKWRISAQSLYAENARLMAALEYIACHTGVSEADETGGPSKIGLIQDRNERILKAKDALASTSEEALSAIREAIQTADRCAKAIGESARRGDQSVRENFMFIRDRLKSLFGDGK